MPSINSGDDFVWIGGPLEWFWVIVVFLDEGIYGTLQVEYGSEDAALQLALCKLCKEALHSICP